MLDADGQLAPAGGATPLEAHGLRGFQTDLAGAVAVQMVLALLGEELDGAFKALAALNGAPDGSVARFHRQHVGLARQLCGRMGVRIGDERAAIEAGDAPVHRRV